MTDPGGPSAAKAPQPIGVSVPRKDGVAKVTGQARYTADFTVAGMCHASVLRSTHPHARIVSIDTSAAARMPGVIGVVTAEDLPDVDIVYGAFVEDHPLLAQGKVRYVGEPVVGVVAEDALTATDALAQIEVEYEPLPFVTDPLAALDDDAPALHEQRPPIRTRINWEQVPPEELRPNECAVLSHGWGDVKAGLAEAAHVIEAEYRFPRAYAYAMEPYAAIAQHAGGGLTVWSTAAHPFMVREDLARCFNLSLAQVRVIVPYLGGAYGSKSFSKIEPLVAALSLRAGRPVKLVLNADEAILTTRSDAALIRLRSGFTQDGRLTAREATVWMNTGAYAESSPYVARALSARLGGPYKIPAFRAEVHCVYTNEAPAASFRGFGAPQGVWAGEQQMDEAAELLGIDAVEIRQRNLVQRGDRLWAGARPLDGDLAADLGLVADRIGFSEDPAASRARAVAISASDANIPNSVSVSIVRVQADGSVLVLNGSTEQGQGSATVLAQIAAAEMGVPYDRVEIAQSDTTMTAFERSTGSSRTTTVAGRALQAACRDAKDQMRACASEAFDVPIDQVEETAGGVLIAGECFGWEAVLNRWFGASVGEIVGRGYIRPVGDFAELPPFWEIGCVGVEVSIDEDTGVVKLERMVTIGDVGQAINPLLTEGQDIGAATMGMGLGLSEELLYDENGYLMNGNLFDYRVPRSTDLPVVESLLAQRQDGVGPYGAKGGGEGNLNPIAPAIANAVWRVSGVRIREAPLKPERVWRAIRDRRG